ncbi:hypothetical protein MNBD_GAMMA03-2045 [hydrothermal vent metagenome]|uniref:FAD-binding FR-type domain-containing protein n=1 Tax=hydrothermal vent metagenome TaxID=652676 RepID=A0A3B0W709_9ZZZZ
MPHYSIQHFSQSEQEGGFWLLSVTLEAIQNNSKTSQKIFPPPLYEGDLGRQFYLENSNIPLFLFQQNINKQRITLQFLSNQSVSHGIQPKYLDIIASAPTSNQTPLITCETAKNLLLLGSGLHLANLFYLAKKRKTSLQDSCTLALLESKKDNRNGERTFPFKVKPAQLMSSNLPPEAIGTSSLLEDWHIPNRLASQQGVAGCFEGTLDELFSYWLTQKNNAIQTGESWQVIICASKKVQQKCLSISQSYDWIHALVQ